MKFFKSDSDKQVIDIFKDEPATIDPKFKADLRQRMLAAQSAQRNEEVKGHAATRQRLWPKLVLVPVVAMAAVALLIGLNLNNSGNLKQPLQTQRVKAAELVEKSKVFAASFDFSKYDYFQSQTSMRSGPYYERCGGGPYTNSAATTDEAIWVYRAPDNGVEAFYSKITTPDRVSSTQVYDETNAKILPDYVVPRNNSLADRLQSIGVSGRPSYLLVDKMGTTQATDTISPTMQDGRMVYVLYTKRNPPYSSPLQCFAENARPSAYKGDPNYVPPVDRKDVNKLVIDASTYEVLLYEQYVDSVTDDNLITSTRYSLKYSNVSVAEALRAMTAAGFDKTTALPTMPAGRD